MKTAIVLFNLGGPDSLGAVKPFLFNLFNDKAIIALPHPLRWLVAKLISSRRAATARAIYAQIGGRSPILAYTQAQADALDAALAQKGEYKSFVAMRHWHPMTREAVAQVVAWAPDRVVLLPLYPHYSTTTTQSAFDAWYKDAQRQKLSVPHHPVCCYPFDRHFVEGMVGLIEDSLDKARAYGNPRILFSAHGLPKKIVAKGDPYQWQVERSVSAIVRALGGVDYAICYQSRVGPLEWIGPSTEAELKRAGADQVPVVVVPVAFVSEHSETLVELDIEYKHLADACGVPHYERTPALGTNAKFIEALAWLVEATHFYPTCSNALGRICPKEFKRCGFKQWHDKAPERKLADG